MLPMWASTVRDELGWLADILGEVRDGDVLLERLQRQAAELPEAMQTGVGQVLATLAAARDEAHARLLTTLRSDRYFELLDHLVAAANSPSLLDEAAAAAETVLPGLARHPWRSLEKRVDALDDNPSDEQLHDIRIRAKRARYAAEAVAPVVGKEARAFAKAAAGVQEVLGELNDAVVAGSWLRTWVHGSSSTEGALAAGQLAELERAAAQHTRSQWTEAWKELSSPGLRSWM